MEKTSKKNELFLIIGLVLGLILGILLDPIRLSAKKTGDSPGPDPGVSWVAIPSEFINLDVEYLSSPENWQETETLISALITKQLSEVPIVSDWEPVYAQGQTFWLYAAFWPVSDDPDGNLIPSGHGFLMLHHDGGQLDGYFVPIGEDHMMMVYPFGNLWNIKYSDLPEQLWEHLEERAQDPSIEPLIVQSGKDLLRQ